MVRKRPAPEPTAPQNPEPSPEAEKTQVEPENQSSQSIRKSWVWKYFVDEPKLEKVRCTAVMKTNSRPCNALLARDRSGSTKSMGEHLFCRHQILNPGKVESGLQDISVMIKKQKTNHVSKV